MKKKTTLLKSLLMAAALLMGIGNAWAAETISFVAQNRITNNNDGTFTAAKNAGNQYALALADLSGIEGISTAGTVTIEFDCVINGGRVLFGIGDKTIRGTNAGGSSKTNYNTNGLFIRYGTSDGSSYKVNGGDSNAGAAGVTSHVSFTLDKDNKKYSYTITDKAKTENNVLFSATDVETTITDATIVEAYTWNNNQVITVSDVTVTMTETTKTYAGYTVKFMCGTTEIKEAITDRTAIAGSTVTLLESDKERIKYEDKAYIYESDNSAEVVIAEDGSSVITVSFTIAPSYTYSIVDNLSNTLASGSAYLGDNVDFYVPYYAFANEKFYKNPILSKGSLSYAKSTISNISSDTVIVVTYTEEANTNVVFYSEAENLEGVTPYEDGYTQIRMSNGKAGYFAEQVAFTTLPAGKYNIEVATRSGETKFYAGKLGEGNEILSVSSSGAVTSEKADFILTEPTDIYASVGSSTIYFDYIIIRKTGDIEPVTVTITSADANLATYVNGNYALDFTDVEGLKAYIVTGTDGGVATLQQVTKVPAGTGVILEGDVKTYDIPVIATADDIKGNLLKAAITETTAVKGDYVVAYQNEVRGFFPAEEELKIPAGKAYLHIDTEGGAPAFLPFAAETTGISATLVNSEVVNNEVYNLAGQRVAKPTKGLYIVGGRKVVVK